MYKIQFMCTVYNVYNTIQYNVYELTADKR